MNRVLPVLLLALVLIGAGCARRSAGPAELVLLAQDAGAYHGLADDARLMDEGRQAVAWEAFLQRHFDPWERAGAETPAEDAFWGLKAFAGKRLFGENSLPGDPAWLDAMAVASRVDDYPSLNRRAIAVVDTSMRVLPSIRPVFYDPALPGEGFPFDYMQNSLVLAGTPLLAVHESADKAWVLVESRFTYGWVPATDLAWVDDEFAHAYRSGLYAAVTRDRVPVADEGGVFRFEASIGSLLPLAGEGSEGGWTVLAAARGADGEAVLRRARIPSDDAEIAPVPATAGNFARLADRMLGQPYGWGGLYRNRDCSATTMDLMAAFGIFLPRNSSQQAKVGWVVPLEGEDGTAKKARLLAEGVPFLTLVRKPGHIMLYIGRTSGPSGDEPVVLHTIWGLRTKVGDALGRAVIGRTVITTLEPGAGLETLDRPDGVLINAVRSFNTLP
ncbi:MAG: SH3 domain-containing protein [Pseudodesulfovibrio sp.]|uniref:SH3 domain-containing protein n=1 Tax=Pseudodesulfovibrio sp. TaxID=2035812 RepID=UPI003D0C70AB